MCASNPLAGVVFFKLFTKDAENENNKIAWRVFTLTDWLTDWRMHGQTDGQTWQLLSSFRKFIVFFMLWDKKKNAQTKIGYGWNPKTSSSCASSALLDKLEPKPFFCLSKFVYFFLVFFFLFLLYFIVI